MARARDDASASAERITELARALFEARDAEERARAAFIDEIVYATNEHRFYQETIASHCDLRDELEERVMADPNSEGGEGGDWTFHRTSIQQFLRKARQEARRQARRSAA